MFFSKYKLLPIFLRYTRDFERIRISLDRVPIDITATGKLRSKLLPPFVMTIVLQKMSTKLPDDVTLRRSTDASSIFLYDTLVKFHALVTHENRIFLHSTKIW
jgi:hypothetical protein